ncbi:FAD-dependent monooxygenase [Nonomuraea sp. NBC_01738]|uniref:FAD-dependent monooxygenase n=1 Tax=Nonomuraea sp. NBC_01738 TaxID=2976003 RepID=UPI002E1154EF|nr:FAD-dependent monooxygenase [Nonomuraea sp. NBC_01738]
MSRAIVIGGGVGGLTAGLALRERGWDVTVVERAPALEAVGSGLAVAVNALRALDTLGLGDQVRELSRVQGAAGIQSASGRWLSRTSPEAAHARYGDSIVLMLRRTLVDLLAGRLGGDQVRLGAEVTGLDAERGLVRLGEETLEADLVVAADGIHSRTRKQLFPGLPGPVYAGVTAWRALLPRPEGLTIHSVESWGRGKVFGTHQLAGDLVYLYATDLAEPGGAPRDEREDLLRRFGDWAEPIPALLRAADPAAVLRNDVYYLAKPLPALHRGKVALIGDAAHPMTPNLGQGACQAIEDAVVLAGVAGGDLAAYTGARLRRTADIVRKSAAICRVTKLRAPLAVRLRDTGMKLAGKLSPDLVLRSMDGVLDWRPPAWSGRGPDARV